MLINGENYKFYEVAYPQYALLLAENKEKALREYLLYVCIESEVDVLDIEIEEVPYTYAKRKYELNPELACRPWLAVDGEITYEKFNSIIDFTISDNKSGDDKILLCELDTNYDELGEEIE